MTEDLKSKAPSLSLDTSLTINNSEQFRQVSKRFNLDVSRVLPRLSKWLTENTWLKSGARGGRLLWGFRGPWGRVLNRAYEIGLISRVL